MPTLQTVVRSRHAFTSHEGFRLITRVRISRQTEHHILELKSSSLRQRSATRPRSNMMCSRVALRKVIADCEASLAAADDNRLNQLAHCKYARNEKARENAMSAMGQSLRGRASSNSGHVRYAPKAEEKLAA